MICLSHPMWVRGLKHLKIDLKDGERMSHPMWVRGLKLLFVLVVDAGSEVAPYVGAWIETKDAP